MPAPAMPPPSAPPAGVTIVPPATPPKPPPPPTREIKLGAPSENGPVTPPKPGSARERMTQSLRAKAGINEPPGGTEPTAGTTPPAPPATPEPTAEPEGGQPAPTAPAVPPPDKGGKVNPWKLVDSYKVRVADLEKKLTEASSLPEAKSKEYLTKIEELTKANEELQNEIRFVNYAKHPEFRQKYDIPYQQAWERAVGELQEITITDPQSGQPRQATAQDLADLLAVPLTKARELAEQYFGNFADDVMAYRKELKGLFAARAEALKQAREQGEQRDKTKQELQVKTAREISDFIKTTWEKTNQELLTHEKFGQYFAPKEGDQDGNQRLAKGFELVDRGFSESPADPRLTPEQRAAVVRRHAAIRNRAAAFGRLVATVDRLTAEKAELEKQLSEYRGSTPPAAGSATTPGGSPAAPASAKEQVFGKLRSLAK